MTTRWVRLPFVVCSLALLVAPAAAANGPIGSVLDPVTKVVTTVVPPVAPVLTSPVVTQPISTTAATPVQTATSTATAATQAAANVVTTAAAAVQAPTSAVVAATTKVVPSVPVVSGVVAASTSRTPATATTSKVTKPTVSSKSTAAAPTASTAKATTAGAKPVAAQGVAVGVAGPVVSAATATGSSTVAPAATTTTRRTARITRATVERRAPRHAAKRRKIVRLTSKRHGTTMLVAEFAPPRVVTRPAIAPAPTPARVTTSNPAPTAIARGGRSATVATRDSAPGLGFDSPLGRFAISGGGVLLGGSDTGDPGVKLVVPSGLVALAALIGVLAVLGQRRAEQRRRVLR